ncbi:MAG TPA: hypothetical protein VMS18_24135 [Candidatus Binatia bacterium]|nr:hypothetical protein [Candidatus Binatia bacterium]
MHHNQDRFSRESAAQPRLARQCPVNCVLQRFSIAIHAVFSKAALAGETFSAEKKIAGMMLLAAVLTGSSSAATKPHIITFGKWTPVQWAAATNAEDKPIPIKIRPLMVDGRVKEFVTGMPHEITERLFVVRRMFRVNDSLPDDSTPRWQWQRGGWLLVDRLTGRISSVNLPEFDAIYSPATWYRDYVAYCGISDDGKKTFAVVAQLNRRKPILKKPLTSVLPEDAAPDSACPMPAWQRSPVRVTFADASSDKQTFAIRGRVVDIVNDDEEE